MITNGNFLETVWVLVSLDLFNFIYKVEPSGLIWDFGQTQQGFVTKLLHNNADSDNCSFLPWDKRQAGGLQ